MEQTRHISVTNMRQHTALPVQGPLALITPTHSTVPRKNGFRLLTDALDYAATAGTGLTFYTARGVPTDALPYRDLRDTAVALAHRLRGLALTQGDRVGLIGETSPGFVSAFFACVHAGLVPVPLPVVYTDPEQYAAQIRRQLDACGARLLLTPHPMDGLDTFGPPNRAVGQMTWDQLADLPQGKAGSVTVEPDDLCYIQYSSGSTRFPRGIAVTHRALMQNCHDIAVHGVGVEPDDRVVSWLPLYHDMGLVGALIASMVAQVSVDLIATEHFARRPLLWLQLLSRNRGTISYAPCFGYDLCRRRVEHAQTHDLDLSRWRVAGVGSELIDPGVMNRFAEAFAPAGFRPEAMLASYGLAEATLAVSFAPRNRGLLTDIVDGRALGDARNAVIAASEDTRSFVCCGHPIPGQEIEIRAPEGYPLPERHVGRVMIRGLNVMHGYFGDEGATAEVIHADGWLDTGDVGYMARDGLVIVGRAKDVIIINGRNVWPQDLESIVEQLPQVRSRDCAAFGSRDGTHAKGERAIVLIQCRASDPAARAALVQAAHDGLLAATGIDCHIALVPPRSLPRTSSGKLNRGLARTMYESRAPAFGEQHPPAALPIGQRAGTR